MWAKSDEISMNNSKPEQQDVRRRYPRRAFRRKIGVLIAGKYWMGHGVELGEGGASFSLGQSINEGVAMVLNFQIPNGAFVSVQAEVRSTKKDPRTGLFDYGVSFSTLKFEAKREIRAFVSARSEAEQ